MERFDRKVEKRPGRWLCIAYAFPPIHRSGTQRTLGFVRHLHDLGWDATVLTVKPSGDDLVDRELDALVPATTRVVRTRWYDVLGLAGRFVPGRSRRSATASDDPSCGVGRSRRRLLLSQVMSGVREWVSRVLMTPDSRIGWVLPGVRAALRELRRHRPDVIYSTSPYMSAHLIALVASTWTQIPWVADFRDPWRGNPFRKLGFRTLDLWDTLLEWIVLRRATHVICNTPTMKDALVGRRPFVGARCSTILNAFDPERLADIDPDPAKRTDEVTLVHCGQFYGPRSPRVWFAALGRALELDPAAMQSVRVELLGPERYEGRLLVDLAAEAGVQDRVRVLGDWPHRRAIGRVRAADGLLLAGPAGDAADLQIPNKLFEYLYARRPIIATFRERTPVTSVLREANAQALCCAPNDVNGLARAMIQLVRRDSLKPGGVRELWGRWSGVERFARRYRACELADVFTRVSGIVAPARVGAMATSARTVSYAPPASELEHAAAPA